MRIEEQRITGKISQELCEDGIVANDDFIAVVDGSTSKTSFKIDERCSNGKLCMETVCDYIRCMPKEYTLQLFCKGITERIRGIYNRADANMNDLTRFPVMRMTASAIVYSRFYRQIWMVGDCQCMVNGVLFLNPKPHEREIAEERAEIIKTALKKGESIESIMADDIGRKAIMPKLKEACNLQNIAFPVIDGFNIPTDLVKVIDIKEKDTEIILASDGYPKLERTLNESENELQRLLSDDPLCINENVATKGLAPDRGSFDDRTYIRFTD